jgi:small conductance mechanosensitive channel
MDLDKILDQLTTIGTTWGLKIIGVLVALFIAWILAGWVRRRIERGLAAREFDATLAHFFANLARYAILVGALVGCLGVFGIQTASFAAVIAALGLAIGLALQGTLSNFASGVMLLIFRPFKVDDWVKIAGELGRVTEVELFTSELATPDNRRIIIPNSKIFGSVIENITHHPIRRVDVPVGVEYGADLDRTREVLEACIPNIEGVLEDPEPQVFLKELGASSVDYVLRVWVNTPDFWDVHQRTVRAAKQALDEAGLGIPFPQVDVHFDEPVEKSLAAAGK